VLRERTSGKTISTRNDELPTTIQLPGEQYKITIKMIKIIIGLVLFTIFISLSAVHLYWGFGGKWSVNAVIPTKVNSEKVLAPTALHCFVVAIGLLGFGLFTLAKSKILFFSLPALLLDIGVWALSLLFILRAIGDFRYIGFFKKINTTEFGHLDSKYYSPLCLIIAFLIIALALTT
jgi:hypothetical protein